MGVVAYSRTSGEITFYDPVNEMQRDNKSKIHVDSTGNILLDDYDASVNAAAQEWVPEPATLTLFVSGLILVGLGRTYRAVRRSGLQSAIFG